MTKRVDQLIFEKSYKKLKMMSQDRKSVVLVKYEHFKNCAFFGSCDCNLILQFSQKCADYSYRPFRSFGDLLKKIVAQTSLTNFFSTIEKLNFSGIYKSS